MSSELDVALPAEDELGEGPWWSVSEQALWRVDILSHTVHRWIPATGEESSWGVGEDVGFAVPAVDGRIVAGLRSGLFSIDLEGGERRRVAGYPASGSGRFNDGKTDRRGRVWAGTIVDDQSQPEGCFGRLVDGEFVVALDAVTISNGLGWSPNNTTMYFTDSAARTIWSFDFDAESGAMSNRRVFATDDDCAPDGLTVDAEGGVWSAKWDGGRVVRYAPDGAVSAIIAAPVSRPTSCMFGGTDLELLYVTSARAGLDEHECSATPAGAVLAVEPGVRGLAETAAAIPSH